MGDMATTFRNDSETDGPEESQACRALTKTPFSTPESWIKTFPQALDLAGTSQKVD